MTDREKVIKGLECCKESTEDDPFQMCGECPYGDISLFVQDCRAILSEDALKLLKGQEAVPPVMTDTIRGIAVQCGVCRKTLYTIADTISANYPKEHVHFCIECGTPVKWE